MGATVAIIPARGGSKGIPRKNLVNVCGKPLVSWSILQALNVSGIDSVWVSSDDAEILGVAKTYGASTIKRPSVISSDTSTSESAWLHAIDVIESRGIDVDLVVALQATSPVRESSDIDKALLMLHDHRYDSLLSVVEVEDFFTWRKDHNGNAISVNYDYRNRKRRQQIDKHYLENGSFYIFRPQQLRLHANRLGGHIGMYVMDSHKMFQIDNPGDVGICSSIMSGFGLDKI